MKKIIIALSLLLAGGLCASAEQINGDLNHDGQLNVTDVTAMMSTILGERDYDYVSSQINGDLNHDGQLNVTDVAAMMSTILGERGYDYILSGDKTYTANGVSFKMIAVAGGTFQMGGTSEQGDDVAKNETPVHSVTLSSYYIGETEVTQALWYAITGKKPASSSAFYSWSSKYGLGDNYPAYFPTYTECQNFITKLNALTGETFRLPTEAEWEYAARGGNKSKGYKYAGSNTLDDVAWYTENSSDATHEVATKAANELGLYDMSGNVYEWCNDHYGYYTSDAQTNPTGSSTGSTYVYRGGGWVSGATSCRVSYRSYGASTVCSTSIGLRLAK